MKTRTIGRALASLIALALSAGVLAQQVVAPNLQSYEPGAGDAAKDMLARIFGGAAGIFSAGNTNEWFGNGLMALNLAVWAVACAWFTWNILSAVMQGSFDGEFLGKRYSSLWMPIRNVTGMVLLIPAWKGWSLAQLSMAYAASLGIGIANTVAANIPASSFPVASPVVMMPATAELMDKMTEGWNCILSRRENIARLRKANVDPDEPSLKTVWASQPVISKTSLSVNYGAIPAADGYTETSCGTFSYQLKTGAGESLAVQTAIAQSNATFAAMVQGMDKDMAALYGQFSAVDPDNQDQLNQAAGVLLRGRGAIMTTWQRYVDNYYASIKAADQQRAQQVVKQAIDKYGWIGAGTAGAQSVWDSVNAALNAPETAQKPAGEASAKKPEDPAVVAAAKKNLPPGLTGEFGVELDNYVEPAQASGSCSWLTGPADCMNAKLSAMLKNGGVVAMIDATTGSPFVVGPILGVKVLKFVGWSMLAIIALYALAAVVVTPVLGGAAIGSLLQTIAGIWFFSMIPLTIFSLQLIVMLPATIVIAWIFGVAAWLVICAEAFLAAPLWALAHMDTDGEGMGQRTAHGYIFLLNLLFRPAILVMCVGFAYTFAEVIGTLANGTLGAYSANMLHATGQNWFLTLLLFAGALWLMTVVNMRVADVSASLLSVIPNQIFTWIGGQFGSDVGSGVGAQASGDFKSGLQSAGGALEKAGHRAQHGAQNFRGRSGNAGDDDGGPDGGGGGQQAGDEEDGGSQRGRRPMQDAGGIGGAAPSASSSAPDAQANASPARNGSTSTRSGESPVAGAGDVATAAQGDRVAAAPLAPESGNAVAPAGPTAVGGESDQSAGTGQVTGRARSAPPANVQSIAPSPAPAASASNNTIAGNENNSADGDGKTPGDES